MRPGKTTGRCTLRILSRSSCDAPSTLLSSTLLTQVTVPLNNSLHGRAALFYTTKRFKSFEDLNRKLALLARKVRQRWHWLLPGECTSQDLPRKKWTLFLY